jgi:hypothetical protein
LRGFKGAEAVPKNLAALLVLGLLAGCATQPPAYPVTHAAVRPGASFDARQARYILQHGTNIVEGQAIIRHDDGRVATCAGDSATLVPDTAYTRARLNSLYGGRRNYAEISTAPRLRRDPQYETYVRHQPCDQEGRFRFDQVADGNYVVIAAVRSEGESRAQGVSIREKVVVRGGETRSVVLTR